jgi:hypothetical protein
MISTLGILLAGALLVLASGDACDDARTPQDDSQWLDVLLFMLCLTGILYKRHKRASEDDD